MTAKQLEELAENFVEDLNDEFVEPSATYAYIMGALMMRDKCAELFSSYGYTEDLGNIFDEIKKLGEEAGAE